MLHDEPGAAEQMKLFRQPPSYHVASFFSGGKNFFLGGSPIFDYRGYVVLVTVELDFRPILSHIEALQALKRGHPPSP